MQHEKNRPIFVVGSPRSGTSILTWCLGQHPNIIPLEESDWMGDFAIRLAIYYELGTSRGDYSLLSSIGIHNAEFFSRFGETITELILSHRVDLERKRWRHAAGPATPDRCFVPSYDAKTRWVDGTPEYSFHVCGLRKLFPEALFIHVFRDVTSVVRSMLHFHHVGGGSLVANEQEAYGYWLRTVSSCLLAERAYGPEVVFRLRHSDLVMNPEAALRRLFNFLRERYVSECLAPLAQRINSSNVPADFEIDLQNVDPALMEQAAQVCEQVKEGSQPAAACSAAVEEIEAAFDERVEFAATLVGEYHKALQKIAILKKMPQNITVRADKLAKQARDKKQSFDDCEARDTTSGSVRRSGHGTKHFDEAPDKMKASLRGFRWFRAPRTRLIVTCLILVGIVGYIDYQTGYERSLLLFYLLPISLSVWFGSFFLGLAIIIISVAVWKVSDVAAGIPAVDLWNAGMAFVSYALFAGILSKLRTLVDELDRRVQERTAALEREVAERQRLDQEIAQVADRERRRLGQDLHDRLGQHLTGTALAAQVLKEKLGTKSAPEAAEAEKLVRYVEEGIDLTRNLARGFFSPELEADGLSVALEGLAENISERFTVNCIFHGGDSIPVRDSAVATQLYRIAQEAVTNAAKHAAAENIDIRVTVNGSELALAITDDGVGIPDKLPDSKGLGLRLMRHGAALIGATLSVQRHGGKGTAAICKLRIPNHSE